jgi:hypothetical protein
VADDGTICFVSDKMHRHCSGCGTVYVDSACRTAFCGPKRCPYCGTNETTPIIPVRRS